MRIIAGDFKGKKILQPKDKLTRPLKDLTKESIFNIINHSNLININIKKSNMLDLFAGVGSFGLECISRGCLSVTFFENYTKVIKILKLNIESMNIQKKIKIMKRNLFEDKSLNLISQKFEIIFIDPPFKEEKLNFLLKKIQKLKLLSKNGIIIMHRHKNQKDTFPKGYKVIIEKFYGISTIIFLN